MKLHQVTKLHPIFLRYDLHQVALDLVRVLPPRTAKPLRDPPDMGIDADGRYAEGISEKDVRRLASHARQRKQIVKLIRHLAAESFHKRAASILNRACLVAIEVDLA